MSLFHRDDKEPRVRQIDEEMATAAETGSRLSDDDPGPDATLAGEGIPPEDSIDEPPGYASRYLDTHDNWSSRSRHRLNAQVADTCESCDTFVHSKPWQSVGLAAAGGTLLALLLSRR